MTTMKNILKTILLVGVTAVTVASCDLDLRPKSAIVFDEDKPFFTSVTDIESFRNGVLASYRAVQYGSFTQSTEVTLQFTISHSNNYTMYCRRFRRFT